MSVAVYRVTEKKCATCRWWQGARGVELRGYQPYYVKVEAGPAPSAADKGATALPFCRAIPRQRVEDNALYHAAKWEKL